MLPLQNKIPVNPEQLRNQVTIYQEDVKLHEREIFTLQELGKNSRRVVDHILRHLDIGPMEQFNLAHKAHESAVVEIKRLELAKLKAQLAIAEAMLAEVERIQGGQTKETGKVILS